MKIKNRDEILSIGEGKSRRIVLDILESTLQRIDTYNVIRQTMIFRKDTLHIGSLRWDLSKKRHVYVIGGGKAGNAMAKAVEEVLGDRIRAGIVVVKHIAPGEDTGRIQLFEGGHPIPNEAGLLAVRRILDLVSAATSDDLFIGVISGGSSALMSCPTKEISLDDEIRTTDALLKCGARIAEINAVRRHLSAVNGGRLARAVEERGAEMINLIVSDGVGNAPCSSPFHPVRFFGTPVAPDATTLDDAQSVLKKHRLLDLVPRSVVQYLDSADPARETPKSLGPEIRHFVLMRPADSCEAASRAAAEKGLNSMVLTTLLEGESHEAGVFLACIAKEASLNRRPISPPCILIAGGETTTALGQSCGMGGPSQELALGFALEIAGRTGICLGAIDTDGTDGPTLTAGGIVDGTTAHRIMKEGIDGYERLRSHDSESVLVRVGDNIVTGNTGTNVCDLNVLYIG